MNETIPIKSLSSLLSYIKGVEDKSQLGVCLDWDDTLVDPDTDEVIEPEVTRELLHYMLDNNIHFCIVTARYYDTVCDENKRELEDMKYCVDLTMHPILEKLGINIDNFKTNYMKTYCFPQYNHFKQCIGILFMGIYFSGLKGQLIRKYSQDFKKNHIIFVDDYDLFLDDVKDKVPGAVCFKRL